MSSIDFTPFEAKHREHGNYQFFTAFTTSKYHYGSFETTSMG